MSKSVNKVFLLGNCGKDPEIKYATSGTTISRVSLATTERRKKGEEWEDSTSWHTLVAFGKTAEIFEKYVTKGKQICVIGSLSYSSWEDKETGQKKYRTEIIVSELVLLGGGKKSEEEPETEPRGSSVTSTDTPITDEDIPF